MRKINVFLRKGKSFGVKKLYPFIQKAVTVLKFIELAKPYWLKILRILHLLFILIIPDNDQIG